MGIERARIEGKHIGRNPLSLPIFHTFTKTRLFNIENTLKVYHSFDIAKRVVFDSKEYIHHDKNRKAFYVVTTIHT